MFRNNSTAIHAAGKVVGHVEGQTFAKRVQASRHMLRAPRGWAVDAQSLHDAERMGAKTVEIEDTESRLRYTATIALIRTKGIRLDRGFGKQICLPLEQWMVHEAGARQLTFGGVL